MRRPTAVAPDPPNASKTGRGTGPLKAIMPLLTKPALVAAILTAASAGAFAESGRPTDYVAPVQVATVDRHADDGFARYQAVVDGPHRAVFDKHAEATVSPALDTYATYLMVVDGM